jgi:hypothetical protein
MGQPELASRLAACCLGAFCVVSAAGQTVRSVGGASAASLHEVGAAPKSGMDVVNLTDHGGQASPETRGARGGIAYVDPGDVSPANGVILQGPLAAAAEDVRARQGLALLLNRQTAGILFASPSLDLTGPFRASLDGRQAGGSTARIVSSRLAYVSIARVATESVMGQDYTGRVSKLRDEKLMEISRLRDEGADQARMAAAQADGVSGMQALQRQLQTDFQRSLSPVIQALCAKADVQLLLSQTDSGLVWVDPALDLTPALIQWFDRRNEPPSAARRAPSVTETERVGVIDLPRFARESIAWREWQAKSDIRFTGNLNARVLEAQMRSGLGRVLSPAIESVCKTLGLRLLLSKTDGGLAAVAPSADVTSLVVSRVDTGSARR